MFRSFIHLLIISKCDLFNTFSSCNILMSVNSPISTVLSEYAPYKGSTDYVASIKHLEMCHCLNCSLLFLNVQLHLLDSV
jgi:hypothetical protein